MAAIFDLSLLRTSDSLRGSLVVSPDLENMGIAVGISLLSCIEVKIYVISYLLPVNGSHLLFLFYFQTWDILRISLIGLPDLENISSAVGMSLLSCI